ncbi:MAG: hypothetical protein VX963_08680 [Actinomycetota bacterium]|jgi:hypothetical protein|nr:hypothetical protein [Acidimicrobiaceae bacterium]MEC7916335.1 hypothetical protein [Actinomycetota bacterium]MEC9059632.1 hypothetical protein [Actinomycetota bacterium]MEC9473423.1 hypothetical protein [Actinomycetota bacterium]MEE3255689.1 hypothetical protein [Actinomycetota bacterium]|tara:strand:+ start:339 stop:890 length:552 start_codon:yes stop_codon:yes gene_type:complete
MGLAKRIAQQTGSRPHPVEKFLEPGENVKWILPAQGGLHPFTMLFFAVFILVAVLVLDPSSFIMGMTISVVVFAVVAVLTTARYRVIAITADDVLLLKARGWRPAKPVGFISRTPRTSKFDVRGQFWSQIEIAGEKLWVHKRFQAKLDEADSTLGRGTAKAASSAVYRANRAKKKIKHARRKR